MLLPGLALILLMPLASLRNAELLKDQHPGEAYVFESSLADAPAIIEVADAIKVGTQWAMRFYGDAFLNTESCEFKVEPIRFWLLTFTQIASKEKVYAVVLPDGTIVAPKILERS